MASSGGNRQGISQRLESGHSVIIIEDILFWNKTTGKISVRFVRPL